jgi:RecJ-like exonuclease
MDIREIRHNGWYESFDEKRMVLEVQLYRLDSTEEIPAVYEVCDVCEGKGTHVNPSIDSHGLSAEDYDVSCVSCNGKRVVPMPDYSRMTPKVSKDLQDHIAEYYQCEHENWHAREYGY